MEDIQKEACGDQDIFVGSQLIQMEYGLYHDKAVNFRIEDLKAGGLVKIHATFRSKTNKLRRLLRFCPNTRGAINKTLIEMVMLIEPIVGYQIEIPEIYKPFERR